MSDRQLDLFGDSEVDDTPDPALVELAAHIPEHVRFGTTTWTFEGWRGLVYRRRYASKQDFVQRSLAEYARWPLFGTVGIDRSYYAPLTTDELAVYAAQLPPDFLACTKVWSELTTRTFPRLPRYGDRAGRDNPAFLDPIALIEHVAIPLAEAFADHTGPLVVEVPPAPGRTDPIAFARDLERFLARAPDGLHYALEVRERGLAGPRTIDVLRAHPSASLVFNLHTRMPSIGAQLDRPGALMNGVAVARLMIPPGQRYADKRDAYAPFDRIVEPQPAMRQDVLRLIDAAGERGMSLFVLVNNKVEGSSPLTVRALVEELAHKHASRDANETSKQTKGQAKR